MRYTGLNAMCLCLRRDVILVSAQYMKIHKTVYIVKYTGLNAKLVFVYVLRGVILVSELCTTIYDGKLGCTL